MLSKKRLFGQPLIFSSNSEYVDHWYSICIILGISKIIFMSIRLSEWELLPSLRISIREKFMEDNKSKKEYIVFFSWLCFMIRND